MKIGSGVNFLNSATVVAKIDSLVNQGAIRNNEGGLIQLSGDLVNNGVFINQDQSIVVLKGDQAQALRGNVPGTFCILTLNNSAGVNLGTDAIVYSHLEFLNGILFTDTHLLTMGDTAIITGPAATRYVDGKLAMPYSGPGAHFFPIGKGGNYRPLTLEFTALTGSSLVTAEQFEDGLNGVMPPNISQLTTGRHWTISQSGGSNMACLLTLDATDYSPAGPVVLLKQDNGTIVALATTAPDYTNTLVFNDFSDFGLGEVCINPTDGGTIAAAQASCTAFDPAEITSAGLPSGHTGTLVYQWQMSITDSLSGFIDIAEANSPSYDPGTISQSTWFRRLARVVCKEDWSGALSSNVVAITVYPEFLAGALLESQTICPNTSPAALQASPPSGGNTPYTYQWQRWSGIGWDDIISETGLQYAPGVLGNTTKYRMVQTSGSGCGSRLTNDILVTVYR
ncbi:MAG: hypothetical protein IH599_05250, partial [Bacteroidales bacterium]|nr:hypothetical protein [Bacteroidales bacterium]